MPGRGTLHGIQKMASYMDLCEKDWYVMKMDVKSFFMGIRKSLLSKRLDDFIISRYTNQRKLNTLRYLVYVTILNDPTENCIKNRKLRSLENITTRQRFTNRKFKFSNVC